MIYQIFRFSCDDHSHSEDYELTDDFVAKTRLAANGLARAAGWTWHRDGRAFCPACNRRLKDTGR